MLVEIMFSKQKYGTLIILLKSRVILLSRKLDISRQTSCQWNGQSSYIAIHDAHISLIKIFLKEICLLKHITSLNCNLDVNENGIAGRYKKAGDITKYPTFKVIRSQFISVNMSKYNFFPVSDSGISSFEINIFRH